MAAPKPYKYTNPRSGVSEAKLGARLDRRNPYQEVFSGFINGIKASDLEERFYRSLRAMEFQSEFRFRITSALMGRQRLTQQFLNIEGEVEIDFLVFHNGAITPVFIDGEIGHFYTAYQADKDAIKTNAANDFGRSQGWRPSVRVPFWKLSDQTMTDRTVREMFSGEWLATSEEVITIDRGKPSNGGFGYEWKAPGNIIEETTGVETFATLLETNTKELRHNAYLSAGGFL